MNELFDVFKPIEAVLAYHQFMAQPICVQKEGDKHTFDLSLSKWTIKIIKERYYYHTDDVNARIS